MRPAGLALFAVVSALSGSAYLTIGVAVESLPPTVVACLRASLGAALLLPIAAHHGALRPLAGRGRQLVVLGGLEFAIPFVLVSAGSQHVASSLVGVLMAAGPLVVVALASRFGVVENVTRLQVGGLLVGMSGVILLLGASFAGRASELLGSALVLGASTSFALGALYFRRTFADLPALGTVAGAMTTGAALLLVPALAAIPAIDGAPTVRSVAALGVLGVFHAAVNYTLFFALVSRLGAARASVTSYVAPAVAVLLGVAFGHEPLTGALAAGLLLILVGSWIGTGGAPPSASRVARLVYDGQATTRPSADDRRPEVSQRPVRSKRRPVQDARLAAVTSP